MNEAFIPVAYLAASAAFILALKWLSSVPTARRGVIVGAIVFCSMFTGLFVKI